MRWHNIVTELVYHNQEIKQLNKEWDKLKEECSHHKLPNRGIEEFRDTCPDCGFVSYMTEI